MSSPATSAIPKPRGAPCRAGGLRCCARSRWTIPSLTAVMLPEGHDADAFRAVVLENFNMSLGNGLSKLAGKVFRIGHLGDFNDLMLMGTICGVEMGLDVAGVPHQAGGAAQAMTHLKQR
jgi:alanine-glyoxylate transaminase / serine-glyoxylate transaminase / serine-pyruvate transaminase